MPQTYDTYQLPNVGVKVLIYGQAGTGKTRFCASAPAPIILSAEDGLLSLRDYHVPFKIISSFADLKAARLELAGAEGNRYSTICLDSVSELAEVILNAEKKLRNDPRQAYGEMSELILEEFRLFRRMAKHVIFTAKMGGNKDGYTGGVKWGPMFPGQVLAPNVPYLFDEMFQIFTATDPATGQMQRILRTQPDPQYEAKDRSGRLAPFDYAIASYIFDKIMAPLPQQ